MAKLHVLLTNDDGPLNDQTSPYIKYLVDAIAKYTDWDLSIVVPHTQRSWIGKAHFAGKDLTASFIYPTNEGNGFQGPFSTPNEDLKKQNFKEWALLDGTPASCTDIGVHHLYQEKGPVDLVISGPNFGRNSTALYITSSGTVGAAMEGALTGVRAIGLSYAFESRVVDPIVTAEAAKISVQLINHLYDNWASEVDLYTINIPLIESLKSGETKIQYAPILPNQWGSIFAKDETNPTNKSETDIVDPSTANKIQFKWTPNFHTVHETVLASDAKGEHNDGVVLLKGGISVTPLKAIFKDVPLSGEIKLDTTTITTTTTTISAGDAVSSATGFANLSIAKNSYIYPALVQAIKTHLPNVRIVDNNDHEGKIFQYGEYEELDFDKIQDEENYFINSYVYRKALIRKHYLSHTIHSYVVKHPESILNKSFPDTFELEVDYAEFLEDSLDEAYELRGEIESGEKTWILKPSMSDRGQGIRIFKTIEQLQTIFNSFEEDETDEEGEEASEENQGVITSQLRHFVVQEYQENPLLLPAYNNKKFHIRTYVVSNGSIEVYVYKKMLTLFALSSYSAPEETENGEISLYGHLTNTCLQGEEAALKNNSVVEFWALEGLTDSQKQHIFKQLVETVGEVFKAGVNVDKINFQPLNNAFEIFGLDFIIDVDLNVTLLEINSYPDFKQTGDDLKPLIYGLFDSVVEKAVVPFFDEQFKSKENELLVKAYSESTNSW